MKKYRDDIGILFELDKCAKATFKRGKLTGTTSLDFYQNTVIKDLEQKEVCKYLGVDEINGIQHVAIKENIIKECYRSARAILKTELNSADCIVILW